MRRLQLLEIEDQPWCPASLRNALTDYLRFALDLTRPYDAIAPRLAEAIRRSGATRVVDLCSGGGGPWRTLLAALRAAGCDARVRLTDLYPNVAAFRALERESGGRIEFAREPVDATAVDAAHAGFRTLFTGFHHFPPAAARRILEDAVRSGSGIGVFEFTERRPHNLVGSLLIAPLFVWLTALFVRPLRRATVLWTYPLPVLPLVAAFDGTVSILRTYSPDELIGMTRGLDGYEWQAGVERVAPIPGGVTWLIGIPATGRAS